MDVDEFSGSEELVVRDQISEILELVPSVPKLERLEGLLKGNEYQEDGEDAQIPTENDEDRPVWSAVL
jgi:sister chromatid cohesion protein DCC1